MLKKANRLTKRGSFNYVYKRGERFSVNCLTLHALPGKGAVRVGFVVSNKLGKAVRRNLVKRRLRAAMQEMLHTLRGGQLIFVAREGICELEYLDIKARMEELLARANLLKS